MFCAVVLLSAIGCKKDTPPAKTAGSPGSTVNAAPPTAPTPTTAKPAEPAEPAAQPTPAAAPTEKAPAGPEPTTAPEPAKPVTPEPAKDPAGDVALPAHTKPKTRVCMRACNKAQSCGTAKGAVSACVGACLIALKAPRENKAALITAAGFYAQEKCADLKCSDFGECVSRKLVGEKALAAAPPIAKNEAVPRCEKLCHKEMECDAETFAQRPGGMRSCKSTCEAVLTSPQDTLAVQRVVMNKTYDCIDKPCDGFDACVKAGLSAPATAP